MNLDKYKQSTPDTLNIPIATDASGFLASRELYYREQYEASSQPAPSSYSNLNNPAIILLAIICLVLGGFITAKIFDWHNESVAAELAKAKTELALEKSKKQAFKECVTRYLE